ncbi:hypothetical protein [uncultured Veillonella sp.]|uniref:hypothetical protein n=1 Tax=uncultured Veillonella sp. TaxID=159268 RepID=UPI0026169AFA|nr:hypothetical protein [uncultured Veillonella sp.]
MSNNQSNNPDVSNASVYDSTEKKRVFKRAMLFSLIFTIITLVGAYASVRGLGPYDVYVSFLTVIIPAVSMMYSLLLISFMIRWYRRGYYQNINKMVKDSPKAAIYSSVLSAIIFVAIWLHGESAPIDVLILFPAIIFPIMLASSSLSTIMRYYMDIIGINKKMTNFNNTEQKDNLANSSFPCETMDGRRSVDVYSNEDMKKQLTFTETPAAVSPLPVAKADKKRTIGATIAFVTLCVLLVDVMIGDDPNSRNMIFNAIYYNLPEFIRIAFVIYSLALSIIMIKMCIFRQYWVTDRVMGGLKIIPLVCIGLTMMFALIYFIYNIQYTILAFAGAVMVSSVVFIALLIVVSVIYCSWSVLSYYLTSSKLDKK